ncbi:MAG: hypothetical protein AAF587_09725 [Bacteroidota bacterium]
MKQLLTLLFALSFVSILHAQVKSDRTCRCPDKTTNYQHQTKTIVHQTQPNYQQQPRKKKQKFDLLHLQVGGGVNHLNGTIGKFEREFNPDLLSYQANGFVGLRMQPRKRKRSNVVGVWGTGGIHAHSALINLFELQNVDARVDPGTEFHEFREWEAGFLFREWFRLSGGKGVQRYTNTNLELEEVNYFIATTGFSFNILPSVKWNTSASFLFGEDFQEISFRPSTGLAFRFNFL